MMLKAKAFFSHTLIVEKYFMGSRKEVEVMVCI